MIDTHRHMWQTALRGYGADWTLAQYFVFFYLEWGKIFRPQDIAAGNLLSAIESLDAGVTTTVDWSHGLQTVDHADAAVDALESVPGRFVLAYGNIQQGPWEWSASPGLPLLRRAPLRRAATTCSASRWRSTSPATRSSPRRRRSRSRASSTCRSPRTPACGARPTTTASGSCTSTASWRPRHIYVHAATLTEDSYNRIAATGGSVSVSTESEQSAGQGYPPTWQLRKHDIPVSLSMDTSVWWSGDLFCAMRSTLGADRSREHLEAHAKQETVTNHHLRAEQVVDWATRGGSQGARHGRHDRQPRGGQEGRRRARQERALAGHVPGAAPLRPRRLPGAARRRPHRDRQRPRREARRQARRHRPRPRRGARSTRRSSSPSASSATGGSTACTPRSPRRGSSTTRTSTRDERRDVESDRRGRGRRLRGDPRGARAAPGDRGGVARGARLPHRHRARRRVRPALRRDPHLGADRRDVAQRDDDGATASDVEGPLYVDDPPWREKPVRVYEDYEGMGDADVLFVRGARDRRPTARRCPTR